MKRDQNNISSAPKSAAFLQAQAVVNTCKQLEDELKKLGLKIKGHEDNVRSLMAKEHRICGAIMDLQAGILSEMMTSDVSKYFHDHNCSVVGIVATLGNVCEGQISSLLSEYLGTENMLAVVCSTLSASVDEYSSMNKKMGYKFDDAFGRTIQGRYRIICLDKLRPYDGDFIADDPQRRLDLPKPRLEGGEVPPGFLGFAVNMISISREYLSSVTPKGHGLRETLFYHLFSHMQVYKSWKDMEQALHLIKDGAISLDGGLVETAGDFLVRCGEEPQILFIGCSGTSCSPVDYASLEEQGREKRLEMEVLQEELQGETARLRDVKSIFLDKKQEYLQFLDKCHHNMQVQVSEPSKIDPQRPRLRITASGRDIKSHA